MAHSLRACARARHVIRQLASPIVFHACPLWYAQSNRRLTKADKCIDSPLRLNIQLEIEWTQGIHDKLSSSFEFSFSHFKIGLETKQLEQFGRFFFQLESYDASFRLIGNENRETYTSNEQRNKLRWSVDEFATNRIDEKVLARVLSRYREILSPLVSRVHCTPARDNWICIPLFKLGAGYSSNRVWTLAHIAIFSRTGRCILPV